MLALLISPDMPVPMLDVRNLSVTFPTKAGDVAAVKSVSFSLAAGETLSLVGESGSGKSVTSLALMGLLAPGTELSGEIWFRDPTSPDAQPVDLLQLSREARRYYRGKLISMIFQEPLTSLNPVYTCGDQLIEAQRLHQNLDAKAAKTRALELFAEVKLPEPEQMLGRYPHQLSGGQQQRVMIAIALAGDPAILIADEPTTALDVTIQATILDLLRDLQASRGTAIVFITHDMGVVAEIADRVAVMYKGDLVEIAPVYDLFANPQHPYTQGLLNCRPRPHQQLRRLPTVSDFMEVRPGAEADKIIAKVSTDAEKAELLAEVSDQEIEHHRQSLLQQTPLLQVQDLTKAFPTRTGFFGQKQEFRAVDTVSFEVYPGETLGLVGESGCGKSTLSRCLLRLIEPTSGSILFDNQPVLDLNAEAMRQLRREMQIVFQNPYGSLDARQTIGAAIIEPMQIHGLGGTKAERQARAISLLERVGLDASALRRMPHEFSGGQRQRICIARTLACEPKFIICDESVSALDVSVQAQVLNLLKDLQKDFNLTYIFISHDLSVVKFISDRIMVMNQGRLEEIGPAEDIYKSPQKPYTQQLIAAIPDAKLDDIRQRQLAMASTQP
ncbi:abc transporter atp-binding protein [Leptolyngbya sp. Heron Island J]|uniref:ABC transporter ATP-binding protein n=1 Tax=Leptolyngbya sp. Heron Island J TaxID=1385935 RepID=UPI0003B9E6CE|nr:ABC transporter ATP-binding protein [Leptolyngbya sp. Heron Island J]ESA32177.1 abc transporter atp-binding protein [Leptolyngbya sp. Heron Island J]